jgi:EAL domain-containing protein (putative c-di-GMP-specific phosphodiesterase class I)
MVTAKDIEAGLSSQQFCLYYQPKFSVVQGEVVGSEALLRWRTPDGTVLDPGAFLPVAEQSGLLRMMSSYIVDRLFQDMEVLRTTSFAPVSFNSVASDFEDEVILHQILDSVAASGLSPHLLEVEITESQALSSSPRVLANIERLRQAGLGLVMDDYGLGYSSVDTLSKWPFSSIKLDQGLIQRMLESEKNAGIVRSAIRMAHELDIGLVAEGVETPAQYQFLLEAGCLQMQGYLVSRPLSLACLMSHGKFAPGPVSMAVGLVQMAIVDHVQWRRRMVSFALRCAALPPDSPLRSSTDFPVLDCDSCQIGRWYRKEGLVFAQAREFKQSDEAHRHLHLIGAELVARIRDGADMRSVQPLLEQLQRTSLELLRSLLALEDHGLAAIHRAGAC